MRTSKIKIIYQGDQLPPKKETASAEQVTPAHKIDVIYNRENLSKTELSIYHPPVIKIKDKIDYKPQSISIWEKCLGPGAVAATIVAVILLVMALLITVVPVETPRFSYTTPSPQPVKEEIDEDELQIVEMPVVPLEDISEEIVQQEINLLEDFESQEDPDFKEANGEPEKISTVDFSQPNNQTLMGIGPQGGSKRGNRRGGRRQLVLANGGSRKSEECVTAALHWLRRHQSVDGRWSLGSFNDRCGRESMKGRCAGFGQTQIFDIGGTALSLLAYTGRGLDHKTATVFQSSIKRSTHFLLDHQSSNGLFGGKYERHYIYNHVLATLAIADLCVMSEDKEKLLSPLNRAAQYLSNTQNEGWAWRYNYEKTSAHIGMQNDTSVTAWVVMALKTAKECGIKVDDKCFKGASRWLDYCYVEKNSMTPANYCYIKSNGNRPLYIYGRPYASTSCGMVARQFMNQSKGLLSCADTLCQSLPDWDGTRNMYYWYYGSLAMFQIGEDYWDEWNDAMKPTLVNNQRSERKTCLYGSWDPEKDAYGVSRAQQRAGYGGRVYTTAMGALTLEVYYRYSRIRAE